jgi:hypothetical protein
MRKKIATKCIGDTCGVLKWDDSTNDWMGGSIYTYLSNIRRPGAHQFTPTQQARLQPAANAQVATTYKIGDSIDLLAGSLDETFQNLIRENCEIQGGRFPLTVVFQGLVIGGAHPYSRPDVYGESVDGLRRDRKHDRLSSARAILLQRRPN